MKPEPNMPGVMRSSEMDCNVTGRPSSSTEPFVGTKSERSNVAKLKRCTRTNTLATPSPWPPAIPKGWVWQPEQELESGADTRLKFRGNNSGCDGSDSGAPVPLENGRPPPSWSVQTAVKILWPKSTRSGTESWYSCPSCK